MAQLNLAPCLHRECALIAAPGTWACTEHWKLLPWEIRASIKRAHRRTGPRSGESRGAKMRAHEFWAAQPSEQVLTKHFADQMYQLG